MLVKREGNSNNFKRGDDWVDSKASRFIVDLRSSAAKSENAGKQSFFSSYLKYLKKILVLILVFKEFFSFWRKYKEKLFGAIKHFQSKIVSLSKFFKQPISLPRAKACPFGRVMRNVAGFFGKFLVFLNKAILNLSSFFSRFFKIVKITGKKKTILELAEEKAQKAEKIIEKVSWEKLPEKKIKNQFRKILKFSFFLILIILPFKFANYYKVLNLGDLKDKVARAAEMGASSFMEASKSALNMNFSEAESNFLSAGNNFLEAQKQLDEINGLIFVLAKYAPNDEARLAAYSRQILEAGQIASELGQNLSLSFDELVKPGEKNFKTIFENFSLHGQAAQKNVKDLNQVLSEIDVDRLPEQYQEQFKELKAKTAELESGLTEFLALAEKIKKVIGINDFKRYLLIFQNNSEMRASGGFIGSFARVDFKNGELAKIDLPVGGGYDTAGGLKELVLAPEPFWLIGARWFFWNANWWPDWRTSAQKLEWFYEKSDGPTVDGVFSFTPTVMERILQVIGPIDLSEKYGVVIDANNFWITTQRIVESPNFSDKDKEKIKADLSDKIDVSKEAPKQLIKDLMDEIIKELPKRLDSKEKVISLISVLEQSMNEKQIMFYFHDEDLQSEVEARGWSGRQEQTERDYLSVINTNIAGQKSDREIKETISHEAEVSADGSIIDTVKIERKHQAIRGEAFIGVRNVDWMRIYVPAGSELLEASGFNKPDEIYFKPAETTWPVDPYVKSTEGQAVMHEQSGTKIYQENGKTVFANWSMVDPGEKIVIYLKYRLPFTLAKIDETPKTMMDNLKQYLGEDNREYYPYSLLVQKQPGSFGSSFSSNLHLADAFKAVWKYPVDLTTSVYGWQIEDSLLTDKYYALILEKQK
jgi:hypothetical protein